MSDSQGKASRGEQKPASVQVKVGWEDRETPTVYANQLHVSHATGEFYITFGELAPPIVVHPEELPETIPIRPVVRVVVSPSQLEGMLQTLATNFESFKHSVAKAQEPEGDPR